jgi:hypothetical protein
MEHDPEKARNLKLILSAFEQFWVDLFCFGDAQYDVGQYAQLLAVGLASFKLFI